MIVFYRKILHNMNSYVNLEEGSRLMDFIQLDSYPVQTTLKQLLQDKSTKKNKNSMGKELLTKPS